MNEILPEAVEQIRLMPLFRDVEDMSIQRVFHYLTRIRKSKFKGMDAFLLLDEIDGEQARSYLQLLVIRHDANNDIRELEIKMDEPMRSCSDSEQLSDTAQD